MVTLCSALLFLLLATSSSSSPTLFSSSSDDPRGDLPCARNASLVASRDTPCGLKTFFQTVLAEDGGTTVPSVVEVSVCAGNPARPFEACLSAGRRARSVNVVRLSADGKTSRCDSVVVEDDVACREACRPDECEEPLVWDEATCACRCEFPALCHLPGRVFHPDTCECECAPFPDAGGDSPSCPEGEFFATDECRCEPLPHRPEDADAEKL